MGHRWVWVVGFGCWLVGRQKFFFFFENHENINFDLFMMIKMSNLIFLKNLKNKKVTIIQLTEYIRKVYIRTRMYKDVHRYDYAEGKKYDKQIYS